MNTIRLRQYQDKLLRRRRDILGTVKHLDEDNREITGRKHLDWLDQAWDENEIRLLDRLSDACLTDMGRIEMALGRMLAGTYGLCLACHRPIEKGRLDILPEAEFCVECQDTREGFERV